jgi:HK97 gp10 family phage protein
MSLVGRQSEVYLEAFHWNVAGLAALMKIGVMPNLILRAIQVEAAAKRNASGRPGPNVITGRLRGSITWRPGQDEISPYVDVGTNVFYAPFVELGTSHAPAYPFLRPALEAARLTV